uniref:Ig-like domain-containing protein n=1 Tax=Astatotilapia calliptera TaxID=8154 RepID=A0A3P8RA15_ASTCA
CAFNLTSQEKLPKGSVIILPVFVYYTLSTGQSQMIGPTEPLVAMTGDDIILPCQLDPARDAVDLTVEWSRRDLKPRFVHLKRDDAELVTQNTLYSRRTSLPVNKLKCGDISLKLSKVQVSDAGMYNCLCLHIFIFEIHQFLYTAGKTKINIIMQICKKAAYASK